MPVINGAALPTGNLKGEDHGATISLILDRSAPGHGPRPHKHPYDVIVPPDTPHRFTNRGPGRSSLVCIHANATFETEWLEDSD